MHDSSCVFAIIDQTVQSSSRSLSVKELCQIAGVSRSGYYAWKKAEQTRKAQEEQDRKDFELILDAYKMHGFTKGARGIYMALIMRNFSLFVNASISVPCSFFNNSKTSVITSTFICSSFTCISSELTEQ